MAARASDGRVTKAGQRVEVRLEAAELVIRRLPVDSPTGAAVELARHPRAAQRGQLVTDPAHWAELPDGHTRATTLDPVDLSRPEPSAQDGAGPEPDSLAALLANRPAAATPVARRALSIYDSAAGLAQTGLAQTGLARTGPIG